MDTLTRSLLDLSQLEGIPSEIQRQDIDLADLLRDLDEIYASRSEQAELKFNMEVENDPTFILGNAAQAETLIRNLLDNAIKFTPSGGQVNVKLSSSDKGVQLNVSDTGIGIPEDDLSHLFSRFHRGRNASPYPGSGLGLAIVKAITDQHQATIDVERKSPARSLLSVLFHIVHLESNRKKEQFSPSNRMTGWLGLAKRLFPLRVLFSFRNYLNSVRQTTHSWIQFQSSALKWIPKLQRGVMKILI